MANSTSNKQKWESGLFDLGGNGAKGFLYAFCLPTCAMASARTAFDDSNFYLNFLCVGPTRMRGAIRSGYNIEGSCCNDCLTVSFCPVCSAIQMRAEVNKRGKLSTTSPQPVVMQPGFAQSPPQEK